MYQMNQGIAYELSGDERLLWEGKPKGGIILTSKDAVMIPFSLLWCGFAIFWQAMVVTTDAPVIMKFWGTPFVLVGIYIVAGRFFVDAWRRSRTFYGISTERVIIMTTGSKKSVKSVNLRTLSEITFDEKRDGSGTITFGGSDLAALMTWGWKMWGIGPKGAATLDGIPNVRQVYDILRQAQREAMGQSRG